MCSRPGCVYSATVAVESSDEISPSATVSGKPSSSAPQLLEEGQHLRLRVVVAVPLVAVRIVGLEAGRLALVRRARRIVAQLRVVEAEVDRVEAQPVDAALEPEAEIVEGSALHLRIVEIQVRLLREEIVQVVLAAARLPLSTRRRRRSTASCSAACRRRARLPTRTSRLWDCRGSAGSLRTTRADPTCG